MANVLRKVFHVPESGQLYVTVSWQVNDNFKKKNADVEI